MGKDNIYYFDKTSPYARHTFGELQQSEYNMSFVIDGTKDSTKVIVWNFIREDLKPNTIVYLEKTKTWWIVDKDRVERHEYENKAIYKHELQLLGAIDILNARDLTNCGFNRERYTIDQMLKRLFSLSDFEFSVDFDYNYVLDKDLYYNYVKTFDNYTPLSAIREICDGFNCVPKMTFITNVRNEITKAKIKFYSKSGINEKIDISHFTDSRELITSSRDNYGTKVLSNVENCISSSSITYPSSSGARLISLKAEINSNNAIIKLPSPAFKVNSITFSGKFKIIQIVNGNQGTYELEINNSVMNYKVIDNIFNFYKSHLTSEDEIERFESQKTKIRKDIISATTITIENGGYYDFDSKKYVKPFINIKNRNVNTTGTYGNNLHLCLNVKKYADVSKYDFDTITWQQGSDEITNFKILSTCIPDTTGGFTYEIDENGNLPRDFETFVQEAYIIYEDNATHTQLIVYPCYINSIGTYRCWVNVNYIPMNDIKMKVDNEENGNDTHLFNQTGKLIDGSAVSKLITSYSKTICSNELTRYKTYYAYENIPQVGTIVYDNDKKYVINNVSIDFAQSENNENIYYCEFTMTLQNACKSALIQANSNIRDYKCPQENNIKRVQLYRDYFELGYTSTISGTSVDSYMPYNDLFNFSFKSKGQENLHIVFLKSTLKENESWYYQLYCTKVYLDKMLIETIDFKDNNIIGYGYHQSKMIPIITRWWVWDKQINVPISYVDDYGEVKGIELLVLDNTQMNNTYDRFIENYNVGKEENEKIKIDDLTDIQTSISESLYNCAKNNNVQGTDYDMIINEEDYKKDGLEIPVFQYICQVGDANNILFGNDFLKYESCGENEFIEYSYIITNKEITNDNYSLFDNTNLHIDLLNGNNYEINNKVSISKLIDAINLTFYTKYKANISSGAYSSGTKEIIGTLGQNVGIIFNKFKLNTRTNQIERVSNYLLFAMNNCKAQMNTNGLITLYVNNYKLR